ncbi:MAG: tyrosine-protein phosphatase [Acidaminococcaceae bacterium]|nr:tyrosine-protein phosphatase [Acidaminococcaceae bacterium]
MIPIILEKQKNIRDLGETVIQDGRRIRERKLIRCGRLSDLSAADAAVLLGTYRVRTVVDLRSAKESEERPDPQWGIVDHFHIPLLSDDQLGLGAFSAAGAAQKKISVLDILINMTSGPSYTPQQYLQDIYRKFITSQQSQSATRRFFELLLSQKDGALLYHCNGGKDRTGIITAFLLTLLNVSWDTIEEDYMETNTVVEPWLEQKLKNLPERYRNEQAKAVLRMMYLADKDCLQTAREEMCSLGGSPAGYLKQVIGITDATLKELQDRLLK